MLKSLYLPYVYPFSLYRIGYTQKTSHLTNAVYFWPNSGRTSDVCFSKLTEVWITVDPVPNSSCNSIILV